MSVLDSEIVAGEGPGAPTRMLDVWDLDGRVPVPGGADQETAQLDGRTVAALTRTTPRYVAVWSDPVPVDPSAVARYIEQLTNARLDLASSAMTWDY